MTVFVMVLNSKFFSGGMLVQKLNLSDLQHEKGTFDGTQVYAQNKRQQVFIVCKNDVCNRILRI